MTKGWSYLAPLERFGASHPLDAAAIDRACDEIATLNRELRGRVEAALRAKGFHKYADGVRNEFLSDDRLFNAYFSNRRASFAVPSDPPDRLDGCRMAVVFHMSDNLQGTLLEHLRGLPTADLLIPLGSPDPEGFRKTYRYTNLRAMVSAVKSVQLDVEDFAFRSEELLVGTDGTRFSLRAKSWPFDADMLDEQLLLGFMRTPSPSLLNADYVSSPILAAGLVRSHLESVLFRHDFHSVLEGHDAISAERWDAALKQHRSAGRVSPNLSQWVTELYRLLSLALHKGSTLSRGEVWAFRRVVDSLRAALQPSPQGSSAAQ